MRMLGTRGRSAGLVGVAVMVALAAAPIPVAVAQDSRAVFARRKALFILNFTRYIEWPSSSMRKDAPFILCIQGTSDTAGELRKLAGAFKWKERTCELRQPANGTEAGNCHLVYIAGTESARLEQTLEKLSDRAVVTVGDTTGFVQRGVHINLYEQGRFVAYELNVRAVKRSSSVLAFDHQLLSQGRSIDTTPR